MILMRPSIKESEDNNLLIKTTYIFVVFILYKFEKKLNCYL
jgi:hypothetical protein